MELSEIASEISNFPEHPNQQFPWGTLFEDIQYVTGIKKSQKLNKSIAHTHFIDSVSSKHLRYFENHETKNDLLFNLFCLSLGEKIYYKTQKDITTLLNYKQLVQ